VRVIEATIGILLIIGLSLGIGIGAFQQYNSQNLRDLTGKTFRLKARAISAENAAAAALQQAREDRERLALYIDYIVGQIEAP
jgi:hypothetical protein